MKWFCAPDRHHRRVATSIPVAPNSDVGTRGVERHALEDRGELRLARLALAGVRDRADDRRASPHLDTGGGIAHAPAELPSVVTAEDVDVVVGEGRSLCRRLANGVRAAVHGDRPGRPAVADGPAVSGDDAVDLQVEAPGIVGRHELLHDGDRARAPVRTARDRQLVVRQLPGQRTAVPLHLERVRDPPRHERLRLPSIRRVGRESVLVGRRLDRRRVRVRVAVVRQEPPLVKRLHALELGRDRFRIRRSRRLATVLVDRLSRGSPVVAGERLQLAVAVDVLVRLDDVAPVVSGVDRSRVVEMSALQVAVVRYRRFVRDVRVRTRTRRVADLNLPRWLRSGRINDTASAVEQLPCLVPVPPFERRRLGRSRIFDRERRNDVVLVLPVALPAGAVEVGLQCLCRLVEPPFQGVADPHGVQTVSGSVLREHGRYGRERRDAHSDGESCDAAARTRGFRCCLDDHANLAARCRAVIAHSSGPE